MKSRGIVKELVKDVLIAVCIAAALTMVVKPTIVRGESMDDTLHDGNYLILNKLSYKMHEPERGDIVVFPCEYDGNGEERYFIKRVIGIEGDTVSTNGRDTYVNGEKISEPYVKGETIGSSDTVTCTVPDDSVFVMGDNRDNSADSRIDEIGCINEDEIKGKVVIRLYPFNQIGTVYN